MYDLRVLAVIPDRSAKRKREERGARTETRS